MNQKTTKVELLLDYLSNISNNDINDVLSNIITFLHSPNIMEGLDIIIKKINTKTNFIDYFENESTITDLISLKNSEPDKYYEAIHYANIVINMLCYATEMPYTVVLNTEDLSKSYFLMLNLGK